MALFKNKPSLELDLRQAQGKQLEKLAYYDVFTALPNRQGMELYLKEFPGDGQKYAYAVLLLLDFDPVHQVFGHEAGNQHVLDVADMLRAWAGPGEMVCRDGLDSFGLFLRCPGQEGLAGRIQALTERLQGLEVTDGANRYLFPMRFAWGGVLLTGQERGFAEMESLARMAARRAQEQGKGCVFFSEAMEEELRDQRQLLADAPASLERREFVPYFHPRYDLKTARIVGAEVLARWNHPTKGLVLPHAFIPALEQCGKLLDLDMYMLEEACKLIRKWTGNEMMPVRLSVNMSERNIYRKDFVDRIIRLVTEYGTPPCLIELELDAKAMLENGRNLKPAMDRLHAAGFLLSTDNFGANYTSLQFFKDIPTDLVKLDRAWFADKESLERSVVVTKNVVNMAHELGMLIVAQGIESREHVEILTRINCNYGQGFLFCRPMPLEQFEQLTL